VRIANKNEASSPPDGETTTRRPPSPAEAMSTAPTHPWLAEPAPSLYYQRVPPVFSDADLVRFIDALEALVAGQRAPFAWVVLADAMLSTSAKQRKLFSEAESRMQAQDRLYCAGTAIVLTSSMVRGVVTAVYWLTPPVYPYTLCANEEQARAWAGEKLAARLRGGTG
jgi:hypothetical protein